MSEKENAKIAMDIKDLKENLPALIELNQLQAKLMRVKFMALINEGFTIDQSLVLCKPVS